MPSRAGGRGGGWAPALAVGPHRGRSPGSLARAPLPRPPSGARATWCRVIALTFAHSSFCQPRCCFRAVRCRQAGEGRGRAARRALRRAVIHPSSAARGSGVRGRWRQRPGSVVRGQWSAGQKGTPLPCATVRCMPPVCAYLVVPPPACPQPLWPRGSGVMPFPGCHFAHTAWGRAAQGRGPTVCRGGGQPGPLACTHQPPFLSSGMWGLACQASGQTPGKSPPAPPAAGAIARGSRRHLCLRLCGGSGCCGGRFLGR